MHRAMWPIATLALMTASFGLGKFFSGGSRSLPAMVATLPGDEAQFSREFNDRIRDRFPVGTSEDALLDYLVRADFTPEWRRRDDANASVFIWNGLICSKIIRVSWRADAAGALTDVHGAYESHCL